MFHKFPDEPTHLCPQEPISHPYNSYIRAATTKHHPGGDTAALHTGICDAGRSRGCNGTRARKTESEALQAERHFTSKLEQQAEEWRVWSKVQKSEREAIHERMQTECAELQSTHERALLLQT